MSGLAMRTTPVTDDEREAARKRMRSVLPHLFIAANAALIEVQDGRLQIGIIAKKADGSGRITAAFEAEAFLRDLETLVGPLLTRPADDDDDDDNEAKP
jgi:hypothetical protein